MENLKPKPVTVDADGGEIIGAVGCNYRVLVSGKQTNGKFSIIDMLVPSQNGPGPHSHTSFYESFYIVDGEVEIHSEAGVYIAEKGSFVLIPEGGIVHCFKNVTDKLAHLICTVVPAGLEEFFEEIGEPVGVGQFLPPPPLNPEGLKKLQAIAQKHGQTLYPPDYLDSK